MNRRPDDVLDELGGALARAWASDARRARRPWLRLRRFGRMHRAALVVVAAVLALVPTAVATRDLVWAPEPPALPGAERGTTAGAAVYVAAGEARGVPWRLSAASCTYGAKRVVGVFLDVPGGGAGAQCDAAAARATLRGHRVHTYFDPVAGITWAFGALPASARDVEAGGVHAASLAADPRAIEKGRLPGGLRVFVVALPGTPDLRVVKVRDAAGVVILRCVDGRCVA